MGTGNFLPKKNLSDSFQAVAVWLWCKHEFDEDGTQAVGLVSSFASILWYFQRKQVHLCRTETTNEMLEIFAARLFNLRAIDLGSCHQARINKLLCGNMFTILRVKRARGFIISPGLFFRSSFSSSAFTHTSFRFPQIEKSHAARCCFVAVQNCLKNFGERTVEQTQQIHESNAHKPPRNVQILISDEPCSCSLRAWHCLPLWGLLPRKPYSDFINLAIQMAIMMVTIVNISITKLKCAHSVGCTHTRGNPKVLSISYWLCCPRREILSFRMKKVAIIRLL